MQGINKISTRVFLNLAEGIEMTRVLPFAPLRESLFSVCIAPASAGMTGKREVRIQHLLTRIRCTRKLNFPRQRAKR
jgi:hypothetical protein